jgi:hypothetical protein
MLHSYELTGKCCIDFSKFNPGCYKVCQVATKLVRLLQTLISLVQSWLLMRHSKLLMRHNTLDVGQSLKHIFRLLEDVT